MSIKAAILTLKPKARRRRRHQFDDIPPEDIDPETNEPYHDYSSPSIDPHPFGGGVPAGDY